MTGNSAPEQCAPKQRIDEIVQILAKGFLRLQHKERKGISGDYFVDFPASPSIHASVKNISNTEV